MQYRTKLYIALAGIALVSSISGLGILFFEFKETVLKKERTKVISVAATTAALIDVNLLKQIHDRTDDNTLAYSRVKEQLIEARDANRLLPNIYIKYLYTFKPSGKPSEIYYLVDAEENPSEVSLPGDLDDSPSNADILNHLTDFFSPAGFIQDSYGTWLSGFAPVFDSEGNYVATVGADISIDRVLGAIDKVFYHVLFAFCGSLLLALWGAHILSKRVTLSLRSILTCVREIGRGNLECRSSLDTHDEFEELGNEINNMGTGLKERERLKLNFTRYVSQHVMEKILNADTATKLEGERRKITVLFSDIRQFTHLSEILDPEQIVSLLNEYFEAMLDVIFIYQGTLDKFIGDGLMVEFGAPLDDEKQEEHAILAALGMQKELKRLLAKWEFEGKPKFDVGIGIHTGLAVVGNIGSERRMEYTAIGDTVNIAARLEQATKELKAPILISETTADNLKGQFPLKKFGPIQLPGRKESIIVYGIDSVF